MVPDRLYAETKDQVGGLGVLEARDMHEAIEVMSKYPVFDSADHSSFTRLTRNATRAGQRVHTE
jgi:hypothetical protein